MKKTLHHFLTITTALSASIAIAQEAPGGPPPGSEGAGRRGDERRPDGARPPRADDFGQPERPGLPGARRDRQEPAESSRNDIAPRPAKPQPYLGVTTSPLDPALTAQLGLTPGLGLIVEEIIPDGPAAKAGVQALDVIKQVNDQLVSNPAHLAALARHFGKDTEVTLLVLRKGQEQKVPLKIGERVMRDPAAMRMEMFGGMGMGGQPFERRGEAARRNGDDPNRPSREPRDGQATPSQKRSADLFREVGPGGAPAVQSFQDRVSTTWSTANAKVMLKDASGEIEVRSDNGKRTMTAKNPKGETAFDGPIDTDEQRKAIPAEFRKMLDQVEVRSRGDRRPAGPEGPKPPRGEPNVQ